MEGYISDLTDSDFEYSDDEELEDEELNDSIIELNKLIADELIQSYNYLKNFSKLINKNKNKN